MDHGIARVRFFRLAAFLRPVVLIAGLGLSSVGCADDPDGDDDDSSATAEPSPTPVQSPTPEVSPSPPSAPPVRPFAVIGSTPNHGAMAVPRTTAFSITLTQPMTGDLATVSATVTNLSSQQSVTLVSPTLSPDRLSVSWFTPCWSDGGTGCALDRDTDYRFSVVLSASASQEIPPAQWPLSYEARFTTRVPCGVSFNIAHDVVIQKLGEADEDSNLVRSINGALRASTLYPVALMYVDVFTGATFPLEDVLIASGLVTKADDAVYELDDKNGLPVTMEGCSITAEDGGIGKFACGPQDFVFPIPITDDTVLSLYFTDALVTGDVSSSGVIQGMSDFLLTGVITYDDLVRLFTEANMAAFVDAIQLDQDLDGDGIEDAATAIAASSPQQIDIDGCDASGL